MRLYAYTVLCIQNIAEQFGVTMIRKLLLLTSLTASAFAQQVTLTGAGSTFAYPLYSKWASEFHQSHPNVQINYQSIGSGGGIRQVSAGTVDFGGTDGPMTDAQLADARTHLGTEICALASRTRREWK